jgi:hypothetical protein
MAALVVLPLPILGPSIVGDYAHTLALAGSWRHQYGYDPQWNHSFAGFTQLLLPLPAATVVTDALALLALGALVWFARRTPSIEAVFGLGVVVALLISPHVLIHDLTLLLVPVAIAIGRRGRDPRPLGFILAAGYFLTLLSLVLISVVPLQFSVVAMVGLGIWLLRPGRPAIEPAGPPAGVIGLTKAVGAGG